MTLNHTEEEAALKLLLEKGFYSWEEASVGSRVLELQEKEFPYFTEYGLDFCADFAFDPVSVQISVLALLWLICHSVLRIFWKLHLKGACLGTGSDMRSIPITSNVLEGVA